MIPAFLARAEAALLALAPLRINAFGIWQRGTSLQRLPSNGVRARDLGDLRDRVSETVHDLIHEMDGSFSAEHGVGRLKVHDLEHYGDPVRLDLMRRIKDLFDPKGIMNPGAVLRPRR